MTEGLDRHDAIHAIGTVLAGHVHDMMTQGPSGDASEQYFEELRDFTAERWWELAE